MTKEQFMSALLPILLAIITGAGTLILYGIKILTELAKAKVQSIKDQNDRKLVEVLLQQAEDLISTAVIQTNQTLVENLKKSNEDGKLTNDEISEVFNITYNRIKDLMGKELLEALDETVVNSEEWIKSKIEYFVSLNK